MSTLDLVELPAREEDYLAWVKTNPHGFIINAHKHHNYRMVWHRADCDHIDPAYEARYVTGDFIKACSLNPGALAEWAKPRPETLEHCISCLDRWRRESEANK